MRGGGDAEWAKVLGLVREKEPGRGNAGGWADLLGRPGKEGVSWARGVMKECVGPVWAGSQVWFWVSFLFLGFPLLFFFKQHSTLFEFKFKT